MSAVPTPTRRRRTEPLRCTGCERGVDCLGAALDEGSAAGRMSRTGLERGDHLYRMGEPSDSLYVVSGGAFKSYVVTPDGGEQVLGFVLPGDVLGIDSLTHPHFQSSAVAIAPARVCRMPAEAIRLRIGESPDFRERLTARMGREIQRLQRLLHLGRCTAEQRVAVFLLNQSAQTEGVGLAGRAQRLPMSRRDIGQFLGLATETVSRVFTRLQDSGALRCRRTSIEIRNVERLMEIARVGLPLRRGG